MHETEFSDALGRLLTDGALRDAFALDPKATASSLSQDASVQLELASLKVEELEAQAVVLLRKRFEVVKSLLPDLVERLTTRAWPLFQDYSRNQWNSAPEDALRFADHSRKEAPEIVGLRELNRYRFALDARSCLRIRGLVLRTGAPALQILLRWPKHRWREWVFSLQF